MFGQGPFHSKTLVICTFFIMCVMATVAGSVKEVWSKMPDDAVGIAIEEVKRRYSWSRIEADPPVRVKGGWRVTVWRLPETPGGFVDIFIDSEGKVVKCIGGR